MELNEIKKKLYLQKPTAHFKYIRMEVAYYECIVKGEELDSDIGCHCVVHDTVNSKTYEGIQVNFEIPVNDMGTADFFPTMEAKLLNRWIVIN